MLTAWSENADFYENRSSTSPRPRFSNENFSSDFQNFRTQKRVFDHAEHDGDVRVELERALYLETAAKSVKMENRPKIQIQIPYCL